MIQYYINYCPVASLVFVATLVYSILAWRNNHLFEDSLLHPYSIWRGHKLQTLITSGFVHKDFGHLFFNMMSFYFFAFRLEQTVGHWQFAIIYFFGMLLSDLSSLYKYRDAYLYKSLGASGAICAVLFSSILFSPMSSLIIFPIPIPIPAVLYGVLFLVYCAYAAKQSADYINHDAHFLGAISGLLITIILFPDVIGYFVQQLRF